ncbi:helix-turn-helix domain-containing protein [Rubrimonas cliftonensis]|uniref:Transcriptional regulator, AraC family n=1 Tax=Rubrimonas cliftonensis TaxID=89524 RepID=A0A1H4FEY3_9RHOB|nr:helix-turn-helix domain-containing protein [Rubrimonas cliftonensis]SEA95741.1 transcriptional regulator, AraC family [Rubrimonas cliftonensis]
MFGATPPELARLDREIDDFEALAAGFAQLRGRFTQMSSGAFRGRLTVSVGRRLRIFRAVTNQTLRLDGEADGETATFIPITRSNEANLWQGRRLDRGALLVKGSEIDFAPRTARDSETTAIVAPVGLLDRAASALSGGDAAPDWTGWRAPSLDPAAFDCLETALAGFLAAPEHRRVDPFANDAEATVLRRLIDALTPPRTPGPRLELSARTRLVARVREHLRDRLSEPVTAMELCETFGVSDRLLRLAFQETHGVGPMAFFRLLRMHQARAALRAARGRDASVAAILAACGVTRPAAFAGAYARHFGERPSETLGVRGWRGVRAAARDALMRRQAEG